jgi:hypothetical protein
VAGVVLATYLNFVWFLGLVTDFINHAKADPVNGGAIAYDIVRFFFRGIVFFLTIVVCVLPSLIVEAFLKKR